MPTLDDARTLVQSDAADLTSNDLVTYLHAASNTTRTVPASELGGSGINEEVHEELDLKAPEIPISAGCVLGDSTTAAHAGQNAATSYLLDSGNSQAGSTITSHATGGETIDQQKARWVADANKATYDWHIVQVGLNDVNFTDAASVAIAKLQSLVDTINAEKKASSKIILCTMTPARSRFIALFGDANGATAYTRWGSINTAIMGGASAITGVDVRVSSHTTAMDDGTGSLNVPHDTGDGIHTTNAAREIQANEWAKALKSAGAWKKSVISAPALLAYDPVTGLSTIKAKKLLIGNTTGTADFLAAPFCFSTGDSYGSGARGSAANAKMLLYDFDYLGTNYRIGWGVHGTGVDFMTLTGHQIGWWIGTTEMMNLSATGNLSLPVAGRTLSIKSGSNALSGTFTANGTTPVAVATTAWDANCVAIITLKTVGGTGPTLQPFVSSITPATGFSVTAAAGDTSIYNWIALKVN